MFFLSVACSQNQRLRNVPHSRSSWKRSGSRVGNPDHTFSETSQPKTAPGKQTLHSLEIRKQTIKQTKKEKAIKSEGLEAAVCQKTMHSSCPEVGNQRKMQKWKPTEEDGQPVRLVVVDDGHADGVESHKTEHHQVESVSLHHAADGDA